MHLLQHRTALYPGSDYVFLGQRVGHHRRSNYGTRIVRPAADGWYPERQGRYGHPAAPVLVDPSAPWPGVSLSPWPPAIPGEPYPPPVGRGYPGSPGRTAAGVAPSASALSSFGRTACSSGTRSARNVAQARKARPVSPSLASWLPLLPGLTPHGLRHGHQTWLDELGVRYVLQSERMGHEVPGMRVSTATSRSGCGPNSGKAYNSYGKRRFMSGHDRPNVQPSVCVGEGRTGLESSVQSRLILYLGRDPGTPGADPLRALDRPGVHHAAPCPSGCGGLSCTQTHQGARQRVRDRAAERGK